MLEPGTPIQGLKCQPEEHLRDFYRDEQNRLINLKDFTPFERVVELNGTMHMVQLAWSESWVLEGWSLHIDPWLEGIHPNLYVRVVADYRICADLPVFRIAEPVHRDASLEARVAALEERLADEGEAVPAVPGVFPPTYVSGGGRLDVEFHAPTGGNLADLMTPFMEMSKSRLAVVRGFRRPPVK